MSLAFGIAMAFVGLAVVGYHDEIDTASAIDTPRPDF
jgi:hypothetical protein